MELAARELDVDASGYHRDPCETPALSSSIARILLDRSPLHAWQAHPRLGGSVSASSDAQEHGTLVHQLVLGAGDSVVVVNADSWRKKVDQEARDAARADRKTPVLQRQYDEAVTAAEGIRKSLADHGVVLVGQSEVAIAWQFETVCGPIWCRALIDHVLEGGVIYDLKTSRSAHPRACTSHVIEYGYDVQRAAYVEALTRLHPELDGRIDFAFLFAETEPPYAVTVARVDGVIAKYGEQRWRSAQQLWGEALHMNRWTTWNAHQRLEAPAWLLSRMEGA